VNAETIRYYESVAFMPAPARSGGGHRVYADGHLQCPYCIRRCCEIGFSPVEIRNLWSLVDGAQVSCERVKLIAEDHLRDIRAKIADLRKMERPGLVTVFLPALLLAGCASSQRLMSAPIASCRLAIY
jgi:MerR family transcriptional regulator, mercuric resistance operon regulatory protein